ncbi:MAG: Rrf2 family transcriptional regulator [Halofilum sp. (in: g-proteobacteria)]|nr:Rrf2 family transcriptional regulator [Halofilum sp. (in: g-proteobacteria)]
MKLTTRGRYAVTAMLDLSLHEDEGPVALSDIAARQDISLSYLEQLFSKLRRRGLVASTRGPGGGYRLNGPAESISVAQVIDAVDEPVEYTRCGGRRNCQNQERCLTHDLWDELGRHVRSFLDDITLAALRARPGVREVAARQDEAPVHWAEPPVELEGR